jgi:hypothetical protein
MGPIGQSSYVLAWVMAPSIHQSTSVDKEEYLRIVTARGRMQQSSWPQGISSDEFPFELSTSLVGVVIHLPTRGPDTL